MTESLTFVMAGGGTGGHVVPSLAVAQELQKRGHHPIFIGTRHGMEAKLVPAAGFPIEWIEIGGMNRVGVTRAARALWQVPWSVVRAARLLRSTRAGAVFSMGGYVAGPVMIAARCLRLPVVVMEPNAMPGMTSRWMGNLVQRALLTFPEAERYFPAGRTVLTGLPVRREFLDPPSEHREATFTLLITGGSRGSRRLNQAARASWPLFSQARFPVRLIHQTGVEDHAEIERAFSESGIEGEVVPFIRDMPEAFAKADLLICRSGAGAVAELAAAGKPAILVPFPYAADQHQLRNAEAIERSGAAKLVLDAEMTGERLFNEVTALAASEGQIERMGRAARALARPDAAKRAADIVEEFGRRGDKH